jgi:hypothetical protein
MTRRRTRRTRRRTTSMTKRRTRRTRRRTTKRRRRMRRRRTRGQHYQHDPFGPNLWSGPKIRLHGPKPESVG